MGLLVLFSNETTLIGLIICLFNLYSCQVLRILSVSQLDKQISVVKLSFKKVFLEHLLIIVFLHALPSLNYRLKWF